MGDVEFGVGGQVLRAWLNMLASGLGLRFECSSGYRFSRLGFFCSGIGSRACDSCLGVSIVLQVGLVEDWATT